MERVPSACEQTDTPGDPVAPGGRDRLCRYGGNPDVGSASGGGLADLLLIFVPLFVAGLCMVPFLIPFIDRIAKRDLEAHRAATAAADRDPPHPDAPED